MTPYELSVAVRGFHERKEREAEEYQIKLKNERDMLYMQAYLISRWVWQKRVNIEEILKSDKKPSREMTDDELLNQAKALNAMFGGEVITNGTEV